MPLVTVTTSQDFYLWSYDDGITRGQQCIYVLIKELPRMIASAAADLSIDPGTPAEAVQVDLRPFHPLAQNAPDLWVYVAFSEQIDSEDDRCAARDTLKRLVEGVLFDFGYDKLDWALDVVWGPAHGYYRIKDSTGQPATMTW